MSLDELLRERVKELPPPVPGDAEPVLERVVAGGRKRRARARLVAGASVAAMLVLIGAATLSLTGDPAAQVDFVGPVPADTDRAALPDCGGLDARGARDPVLSADGRVLAFIDSGGSGSPGPIVVCDAEGRVSRVRAHGETVRAIQVALSGDGRFVAFDSISGLGTGDDDDGGEARYDVFVLDRQTGAVERVSLPSSGGRGIGYGSTGVVSDDGRWVAFVSTARLTDRHGLKGTNVYLRDRARGTTTLLTAGLGAGLETQDAFSQLTRPAAAISMAGDGTLVFNTLDGVFLHDPRRGTTRLVRRGLPAKLSHDGRFLLQPERVVTPDQDPPPRVRVIELASGREELIPFGPTDIDRYVTITDAAISGSGRFVVAALMNQPGGTRQPDGSVVTAFTPDDTWGGPLIVHDRSSGRAVTLLEQIVGVDLSVTADGRAIVGSMWDDSFRGLNGVVMLDTVAGTAARVTWNPPWYEGRAWLLTMWGAALLTLLGLHQLWRLWWSPLRSDEIKQLAFLIAAVGGIAGWAAIAGARAEGLPLLFLAVPVVIAWVLRPHRWSLRRPGRA